MEQVASEPKAVRQPGEERAAPGAGGSGEGSRSALEQLLRQERHRNAQQPREPDETGTPAGSPP